MQHIEQSAKLDDYLGQLRQLVFPSACLLSWPALPASKHKGPMSPSQTMQDEAVFETLISTCQKSRQPEQSCVKQTCLHCGYYCKEATFGQGSNKDQANCPEQLFHTAYCAESLQN